MSIAIRSLQQPLLGRLAMADEELIAVQMGSVAPSSPIADQIVEQEKQVVMPPWDVAGGGARSDSLHPDELFANTLPPKRSSMASSYTRRHSNHVEYHSDDDDDEDDLPPIHVKEALTYSLAITIVHELFGNFLLVYSVLALATATGNSLTDIAFGIAAAAFVYSHIFNKAHFNPWVTIYLFLTDWLGRSFDAELIELYPEAYRGTNGVPRDSKRAVRFMSFVHIVCQFVGSTLAALLVYAFPGRGSDLIANTVVAKGLMDSKGIAPNAGGVLIAMLLEMLLTYALLYSLDIGDESNHRPGRSKAVFFSVGPPLVIFLGVCTIGEFTGASFNVARTFASAVVSNEWGHGAIGYYAIAQFLAVLFAIAVEQYRFKKHIRTRRKELKLMQEAKLSRRQSKMASRKVTAIKEHH